MIDWAEEEKVINLRNKLQHELHLKAMSFTDFERYIVLEDNGIEEIVQVKEVTFEAEPNTCNDVPAIIRREFSEKLGWEYINTYKQAWVNGLILYHVNFKY